MAKFFDPNYDPTADAGTSGAEVTDLNPEQAYDTDLRRFPSEERQAVESLNDNQDRVGKFCRAAKTAGAYRQRAGIAEPTIRGKTPRTEATMDGVALPSMGDTIGRAGSTGYARKPGSSFGKQY
jgi:hypothetical protein